MHGSERPTVSRRVFLGAAAGAGIGVVASRRALGPALARRGSRRFSESPFALGVASGDPLPDGVVLWTRLAPDPLSPDGGMPSEPVTARWEVASDERFGRVVSRGRALARPEFAHSVHVDVRGLEPGREYFYRFIVDGEESPRGRTRTAPDGGSNPREWRVAFTSCQHYESGYYTAHRALADEDVDTVAFLGDYIYEDGPTPGSVRTYEGPEPLDLPAYRVRYARHKTDTDLQAAHAAHPWLVVWDDHEVDNNYASDLAERDSMPPEAFLARRTDAYRAWWEHQPVRMPAPDGPDLRIYRSLRFGQVATVCLLDTRQYRTNQPCDARYDISSECDEMEGAGVTMIGERQEAWLHREMTRSRATWNLVAQQVMVGTMNFVPGAGVGVYDVDTWDGYPPARRRLLDTLVETSNPVVLTGDIHSSWVHDLRRDPRDRSSPVVATELIAPPVTSTFPLADLVARAVPGNPDVRYFEGTRRGYTIATLGRAECRADFRFVSTVSEPSATIETGASFVIEAGRPGAHRA